MISIHPETTTTFTTTGYGRLEPHLIEPVITEQIGGEYSLTFTYPADAPLAKHMTVGALVAAPVPTFDNRQGFRITTIEHTLAGLLRITALHISYDLAKVLIADTNIVNKTPYGALQQLRTAATPAHAFTATSSVSGIIRTIRVVRQSILECLMDAGGDNTFAARYGGELVRNNLHIQHHARLGADNGVTIRDQKNLTGYQASVDTTKMLTRALPVGFDGLVLPEKFVDSPRINDYPQPLVGVIRFEHIKAATEGEDPKEDELPLAQAHEALRQAARDAFAHGLDLPVASYEVNFVDLTSTREYAGLAKLEQVVLGDTVTVIHSEYKEHLKARVMGYTYNPAMRQYISLSLGAASPSFTSTTRAISRSVDAVKADAANAVETALAAQVSANGKNTIHYGPTQPTTAQLGDTWFKNNGEKTEIWIYKTGSNNQPTWVSVASDLNHSQVQAELDELEKVLDIVRSAVSQVESTAATIDTRMDQAEKDFAELDHALTTVRTRVEGAESSAAHTAAALGQVNSELASLNTTLGTVNTKVTTVEETAQQTKIALSQARSELDTLETTVGSVTARVGQVETKANQTAQALTNTNQLVTAAQHKADQTAAAHDALKVEFTNTKQANEQALVAIRHDVLLRATKGDLIAQINVSPETILIDGKRVHITGTTTIDNAVIQSAMIADAAITNAKIHALDASKITAGYVAAARIQAGSITSDKLTIATGFITTAMIADAAITNAKIQALDASKITTGYLAAARIAAGAITSDKLTVADGFIKTAMIADAAITNAKIQALDASKITTGYLAAARIQAGAITSDKLTIANGFIKTAMIADAAITNAKIAALDAAKITTGTLNAGRIAAKSITADKLAANAIQVGLAGWTQSIRITPTQLSWYDGSTLEGTITSSGMKFYYGTRHIGDIGRRQKKDAPNIQGIINHLAPGGDYTAWTFQETTSSDNLTYFTFDPKGKFYGQRGIHMGADLRTHGYKFYTTGHRFVTLEDITLGNRGTFPGWSGSGGRAQVVFTSNDLMIVTNNTYYSMTAITARINDLIMRVNSLITSLNRGWVQSIRDNGGGTVAWQSYSNTGLSTMSTTVS